MEAVTRFRPSAQDIQPLHQEGLLSCTFKWTNRNFRPSYLQLRLYVLMLVKGWRQQSKPEMQADSTSFGPMCRSPSQSENVAVAVVKARRAVTGENARLPD